uniref:Preprotein-translocase subunit g n=1 Tax=Sonderella linearis TaxID=110477 RepID=A0A1Z1MMM8_9FLOR|nr:preprotein-translocase subunit g [Sonderella linearis]ARW67055.1 preprotein-translocase subunit g [Sonderella linearis]
MIKLFWYISGLLTIFLILLSNNNNGSSNFINQSKILNFRTGQSFIQKFIIFIILLFFILTIISLFN